MYSWSQRVGVAVSFFTSCLFVALPFIAALNFILGRPEPPITLVVDNVVNRLGVEDYFMNKKVMLTDLVLNIDAGEHTWERVTTERIRSLIPCRLYQDLPLEHQAALPLHGPRVRVRDLCKFLSFPPKLIAVGASLVIKWYSGTRSSDGRTTSGWPSAT